MTGANIAKNSFFCIRVVPVGKESSIHTVFDGGIRPDNQHNFGTGNLHICPAGMYMRGYHDGDNVLACSDGVNLDASFVDANGKTQNSRTNSNGHICPIIDKPIVIKQRTLMTGIHAIRNDFACASWY